MHSQTQTTSPLHRIQRGDILRVVWHDAVEGTTPVNLSEMRLEGLKKCTDSTLVSFGRFLRILNGRMILDEVIREESDSKVIYEKQAHGKWLSIPLGVISSVAALGDIDQFIETQTKRRRTIFKQLRFIPRSTRLRNGEPSRTLYLT